MFLRLDHFAAGCCLRRKDLRSAGFGEMKAVDAASEHVKDAVDLPMGSSP